ncbi:MAG TPA: hypothetical protein VMI32_02910 [Candidatus Solibacter sp.]|nr:hypothetical protein [Candidatus Solibacter sp.]
MFLAGAIGSSLFGGYNPPPVQSKFKQMQQEFASLGQDLRSGNLTQAQSDFSTLQQLLPSQWQSGSNGAQSNLQNANPVSQAIAQLGQDLKAGNLSAAQSDFTTLQQDLQQQGTNSVHRHHHHHAAASGGSAQQNGSATLFGELGQDLQSGNLTAAQQTYSALQQDFLQFAAGGGTSGSSGLGSTTSAVASLNVSA